MIKPILQGSYDDIHTVIIIKFCNLYGVSLHPLVRIDFPLTAHHFSEHKLVQ